MAEPQDTPQIEGLPPGAVVKPLAAAPQPQIEGLPPGAIVKQIGKQYSGVGQDQDPAEVAARHARANAALSPQEVAARKADVANPNAPESEDFGDQLRTGIGKRGLQVAQGTVGLVNKVLPESVQLPVPGKELETETHGAGETLGGLGADVALMEAGGLGLKGFSTLLKLPESALALAEKYPKASKMILSMVGKATGTGAEITEKAVASGKPALETAAKLAELKPGITGAAATVAKSAGQMAAQSAVEESAPGGQGPAAGAKEGAVGGALGATFAEVTGPAIGKLAKAVGLGTDAEADIMRAAQTGKRNVKFLDDWKTAQPRIAKELEVGGDFKDMGEAADRIGDVRRGVWEDEVKPAIDRHGKEVYDATNVAGAVRKILTDRPELARNFPEDAQFIQQFADKYTSGTPLFTGDRTVSEAEKEIELYNAKLTDAGYWKKSPKERAAMETANPKIAAWRTASNALREGLYQHLASVGEPNVAEMKNLYGAIGNVENEIRGQVNVSARQRPVSLKQMIGMAAGIAHGGPGGMLAAVLPIVDKLYNEPVALLNRAVAKAEPGPVRKAATAVASAAGAAAKEAAPATGALMIRFIASDGSTHEVPVNKFQEAKKLDPGLQQLESGAHFQK
jgi:hypothetical protein